MLGKKVMAGDTLPLTVFMSSGFGRLRDLTQLFPSAQ